VNRWTLLLLLLPPPPPRRAALCCAVPCRAVPRRGIGPSGSLRELTGVRPDRRVA
jgi:hypothetical protein